MLVIVFTANHCPTAQAYEGRIEKLRRRLRAPRRRARARLAERPARAAARRAGLLGPRRHVRGDEAARQGPGLVDSLPLRRRDAGDVARYGPAATPHVFVFDSERKLRFVGRVDDNEDPAKAKTADARDAIEAVLAGKPVPVATTKVFGCSIKWSDKRAWVKEGFESWAREPVTMEPVDAAGVKALAQGDAKKLRLVNVWATWCGPCVIEFPDLVSLHRIYRGRDFEVVTVNADDPEQQGKARAFLEERAGIDAQPGVEHRTTSTRSPRLSIRSGREGCPTRSWSRPAGRSSTGATEAFDVRELRRLIVEWLGRYYHSVPGRWRRREVIEPPGGAGPAPARASSQ